MIRFLPFALLALAACADFPELDATVPPEAMTGAYPNLLPLDDLLNSPDEQIDDDLVKGLQDRLAALNARAAKLRRARPIDPPTRRRMMRGIDQYSN